jgi:hypothetical protein
MDIQKLLQTQYFPSERMMHATSFQIIHNFKNVVASVDSTLASAIARSLKLCDTLFANEKAFFRSSAIFSNGIKGHPEFPL